MPLSRPWRRILLALAATMVVLVVGSMALIWGGMRAALRFHLTYYASSEREYRDLERKLREAIGRLQEDDSSTSEATERIFELLGSSRVASNSREVRDWREAEPSAERTAVALKWAEVAADEAAFEATLHAIWT